MMPKRGEVLLLLGLVSLWAASTCGEDLNVRTPDLYCGACKGLFDEIEWRISQVNPSRRIDVGTFRIDANGKKKTNSRPYATSETHLTEVR